MRWLAAVMIGCWILLIPPSGGPDEPSHVIRSASVVRGDAAGSYSNIGPSYREFNVPVWVGEPDPVCYAFNEQAPASCLESTPTERADPTVLARGAAYPIWGHLLPGLSSFGPERPAGWIARALSALVPTLLIVASSSLVRRRGAMASAGFLMALTPMALFSIAVVNPSGPVIGGGIALWVGSIETGRLGRAAPRLAPWLVALGWAAVVMPRRDGLIWAALIVGVIALADDRSIIKQLRPLGRGPIAVIAASTGIMLLVAALDDSRVQHALVFTPLIVVAFDVLRWLIWRRSQGRQEVQVAIGALAAVAAVIASFAVMATRPRGFDSALLIRIMNATGTHLIETIGVLGWLDTPVPMTAVFLYCALLGMMVTMSVLAADRRGLALTALVLGTAILVSWVLEMFQDNESAAYWQGRYWLPFIVGIPLVLGRTRMARLDPAETRRIGVLVGAGALVVANVAFAAAARRWGVGTAGTLLPWRWDTYGAPLPPALLVVVHVGASVGLYRWLFPAIEERDPAQEFIDMSSDEVDTAVG